MKATFKMILVLCCGISFGQTNLLDTSTWTVGTGSVSGFTDIGTDAENVRETGTDPFGQQSVLWKAVPDAANGPDGGWNGSSLNIDHTKAYRMTVWIKKTNSNDGYTYFGLFSYDGSSNHTTVKLSDGNVSTNPYFFAGDLPNLDTWYLLVGYIYGSGYSGPVTQSEVYDGTTGTVVSSPFDKNSFKFSPSAQVLQHRAYLYWDTNTSDRQYFYAPTVYEINGQEPTIAELLSNGGGTGSGGSGNTGTGATVWSQSGADIHYDGGNVGIGTTNPISELHVSSNTSGDAVFRLEADTDNNNETDNPRIQLRQDGDLIGVDMGFSENFGDNKFGIAPWRSSSGGYKWETFVVDVATGNIGIGTNTILSEWKLAVNGKIRAKEIKVETGWADYVFAKDYELPSLREVEKHIQEKGHLINIPSAAEVEANGIQLGEMNKLLLEKIEELTLYTLEQDREIRELKKIQELYKTLEQRVQDLE